MASSRSRKNEFDEALEGDAHERRGHDRERQQPRQAPVGVVTQRAVADRREERHEQPPQVAPEVDQQRDERAQVEHHVERGGVRGTDLSSRAAAARR